MREVFCILALVLIAPTGNADLIDLDKYILSTGDHHVDVEIAFPVTNETEGYYAALVSYDKGPEQVTIFLLDSENATKIDEANLTAGGSKPVNKPYPGWMLTNSTTDEVTYTGIVKEGLLLTAIFSSYQVAINQLPDMKVISREEYQDIKAAELQEALN